MAKSRNRLPSNTHLTTTFSFPENQLIGLRCGLRFARLEQVPVDIDRDLDGAVSHLPLNVVNVLSLLELHRPERVAQVVPAELADRGGAA